MKNIFLVSAVLLSFVFISCKRDRACSCTTTVVTGSIYEPDYTLSGDTIFYNVNKRDADTRCEGLEQNYELYYNTYTTVCDLKD